MGTITCALPMRKQKLTRAQRHAQMAQPGGREGLEASGSQGLVCCPGGCPILWLGFWPESSFPEA